MIVASSGSLDGILVFLLVTGGVLALLALLGAFVRPGGELGIELDGDGDGGD
ncbi:hypothetical protein [Salinarimonas sp.]|uniref:hypothetical protein n=1 Tax=Salinarimonas sp. TaxID=2766526 RepID=UPI0032D96824